MADLVWEGNTEDIFEKVASLTPKPFRKQAEKSLIDSIVAQVGEGGTVTEEVVVNAMKETAPKPFLAVGLKKIRPLLSKDY